MTMFSFEWPSKSGKRRHVHSTLSGARCPSVPQVVKPERLHLRILEGRRVRIVHLQHRLVLVTAVRE